MNMLKNVKDIGIVCIDNTKLSPVAAVLLRNFVIKSKNPNIRNIQVYDAGYERGEKIADSARGFLQKRGFGTTFMLETTRIDKKWVKSRDLILTMDKFLKRDIIYDFPMNDQDLKLKVFTLNEISGINERIRDPGEDYGVDLDPIFELIEKCCKKIIEKLEKAN